MITTYVTPQDFEAAKNNNFTAIEAGEVQLRNVACEVHRQLDLSLVPEIGSLALVVRWNPDPDNSGNSPFRELEKDDYLLSACDFKVDLELAEVVTKGQLTQKTRRGNLIEVCVSDWNKTDLTSSLVRSALIASSRSRQKPLTDGVIHKVAESAQRRYSNALYVRDDRSHGFQGTY